MEQFKEGQRGGGKAVKNTIRQKKNDLRKNFIEYEKVHRFGKKFIKFEKS